MGISQLSMFDDRSVATPTFTSPPDGSLFSPRSQRCHIPGLCGTGSGNMRQPVIRLISKQLEIPNDLNLENTHSSKPQNISETLLKHGEMLLVQTGSWNWLLCRMRAVGVWRIIQRIRTGLKPFDHRISHHRGLDPIIPRPSQPQTSQSATICGRRNTWHGWEDWQNQNSKPLRRVKFVNRPSTGCERKKPLRPTTSDAGNQLASWWTQEAARLRQRQGRRGMPGFWSCDCVCLRVSCTVSMFEKIVQCLDERGLVGKAGTLLTIHTILEHSRCSSWHLGFAIDYDNRQHSEFRWIWMNLERRMTEWVGSKNMEKLWKYMNEIEWLQ